MCTGSRITNDDGTCASTGGFTTGIEGIMQGMERAWNETFGSAEWREQAVQGAIEDWQTDLEGLDEVTRDTMNSPEGIILGMIFDPSPLGEARALGNASEAAFRAADRAYDFAVGAKHLPGAGGNWARFAAGQDPNALLREALRSPGARFLPNDATSFRVVTDLGRPIGSRGETGIRAVVDQNGHVVTWFPVRP